MLLLLLLLLLCNGVDLAEEKTHREPWGFRTVPRWVGNDSFNEKVSSNFLCISFFPHDSCSGCVFSSLPVLNARCIFVSFCTFFICIVAGLDELRCDCVQRAANHLYLCSHIGCIQRGNIFTSFVGGRCVSCIHFPRPAECFQATGCARLFSLHSFVEQIWNQ